MNGYIEFQRKAKQEASEQTKKQAKDAYSSKNKENEEAATSYQENKTPGKSFNEVFSEFMDNVFKKPEYTEAPQKKAQTKESPGQRGDDITADISISIIEAHNGTIKKINILHTEICGKCKGKMLINGVNCAFCQGKGEISNQKKVSVKIPANVKEGSKIKISGEGNRGINGGQNGDLYLLVHIEKHSLFTFENLNVVCEIPITPSEAALGADIEVPTVDGFVTMKIPPETQSGQRFRLAGQGILDSKTSKKGDHIVISRIEIPEKLTQKEKDLYIELARIRKFNPREGLIFDK